MIRINLLPFRAARKKENVRRQVSIFLLSLALLFLCFFVINSVFNSKIETLDTKLTETKKEIDQLTKIIAEIKKIKKEIEISEQKIKILEQLETNRTEQVKLIDAMTGLIVPNRMWFTAFDAKGTVVNIEGIAIDNKTVADFMTRLEKSPIFAAVNLQNLKLQKIRNLDMKKFKITCTKASNPTDSKKSDKAKKS